MPHPDPAPFITAFNAWDRGGGKVPTKLRMYVTGVDGIAGSLVTITIGSQGVPGEITAPVMVEPGIYTIDFELGNTFDMAGDQGIGILILSGGAVYSGRATGDAPRIRIL